MPQTKVYLDNCSFNRPYDNQLHPMIRLETEAKLLIQHEILKGNLGLVWSFILHYENNDNPYTEKRNQMGLWEKQATDIVVYSDKISTKAREIMSLGIKVKDALHLSCAIHTHADCFITTDKKLLNKTIDGILISNPIDFLRGYLNED